MWDKSSSTESDGANSEAGEKKSKRHNSGQIPFTAKFLGDCSLEAITKAECGTVSESKVVSAKDVEPG
jgi:hypothetical protein